jgi:hypothetical protein
MTTQDLEKLLQEQHETGSSAFGRLWQGPKSDWQALNTLLLLNDGCRLCRYSDGFLCVGCGRLQVSNRYL